MRSRMSYTDRRVQNRYAFIGGNRILYFHSLPAAVPILIVPSLFDKLLGEFVKGYAAKRTSP